MLTVKYQMTDGTQLIQDGFDTVSLRDEFVSSSEDGGGEKTKMSKVCAWKRSSEETVQFGPVDSYPVDGCDPIVWVMNEAGATVAKYHL